MLRFRDLSLPDLQAALSTKGLTLDCGGVRLRVRSPLSSLAARLQRVYGAFPVTASEGVFDVTASLGPPPGWRRVVRRQVVFVVDGNQPFEPFPADTDLPLLEWGFNWCIAHRSHHRLMLHAGVVERDGCALVLPALPGSGKSTLTAALSTRGWRLLSDEFGAVSLEDGQMVPMLRPVALKNESIDIIRRFAPEAVFGPDFPRTRKGTVAHLAPDTHSVDQRQVTARPIAVLFPRFTAGAQPLLEPLPRAFAFAKLAANSFNYSLLGPAGFAAMHRLIRETVSYRIGYGSLADALEMVERLYAEMVVAKPPAASTEMQGTQALSALAPALQPTA